MSRRIVTAAALIGTVLALAPTQAATPDEVERVMAAASRGLTVAVAPPQLRSGPPLAATYADALLQRSRGRDDLALQRLAAARALNTAHDAAWDDALLEATATIDPNAIVDTTAAAQLWRRWGEARLGRCPVTAADVPDAVTNDQLWARGELDSLCGRHVEAAVRLSSALGPAAQARTAPPRLALAYGLAMLRATDDDNASLWCHAVIERMSDLPRRRVRAELCAARADARRGLLPQARDQYLRASAAALRESTLAATERAEIGLGLAWAALGKHDRAAAQTALEALGVVDALPWRGPWRATIAPLSAWASAQLGQIADARRLLARSRGETPQAALLRDLALAELSEIDGSGTDSTGRYLDLVDAAQSAGFTELALVAASRAAARSLEQGAPNRADAALQTALARWSWPAQARDSSPLNDPALTRRALQLLAALTWSGGPQPREATLAELVALLERTRSALNGAPLRGSDVPDLATVQRFLAGQDAALLTLIIGESRTFALFSTANSVQAKWLSAGSDLERAAGALALGDGQKVTARAVELHGGLAHTLRPGQTLLIQPDGFLTAIPWAQLPPPPNSAQARDLGDVITPVVTPSLIAVVAPVGMRTGEDRDEATFLGLVPPGHASLPAPGMLGLHRFAGYETRDVAARDLDDAVRTVKNGVTVLHLGLPLVLAGRDPARIVFTTEGASTTLANLLGAASPELLTLAPEVGPERAPASLVRAALAGIDLGVPAGFATVRPLEADQAKQLWRRIYDLLARGRPSNTALEALTHGSSETEAVGSHGLILVGHAGQQIIATDASRLPFWLTLAAGLSICGWALWRLKRRQRDPFEREPPPE